MDVTNPTNRRIDQHGGRQQETPQRMVNVQPAFITFLCLSIDNYGGYCSISLRYAIANNVGGSLMGFCNADCEIGKIV